MCNGFDSLRLVREYSKVLVIAIVNLIVYFQRKYREGPAGGPGGRGAQRQHAPKITDERDFPTLG